MKRNDVVSRNEDGPWVSYGRISRQLPDGRFEALFDIRERGFYFENELTTHPEYKGRWMRTGKYEHWKPMPTLRQLKQIIARFDIKVWKKYRTHPYDIETYDERRQRYANFKRRRS